MNLTVLRTLRWVILGFGLAAGVLLLATGHLLLGALLGGFAVLRPVLMLGMQRRRRQYRTMARTDPAGDAPPVLRTLARGQFEVAAGAIGVPPADLRIEFAKGRSIAEVASAHGVPVETVVAAVVAEAAAKVDRAVADGETPPGAADRIKGRLPQWATRMVNGHRGELRVRAAASR
jgi:hypothetical protein